MTKLLLLLTTATAFEYDGFAPLHDSKTCASDAHLNPWNEKLVGVNLGSLFVLEPWITPSLFTSSSAARARRRRWTRTASARS